MFENVSFLLEMVLRCAINRLGHAFPQTRNVFTNSALIPKIYLACSFADAMFSLGNFRETFFASCLSCTCRALPGAKLHISVFCACALCPKLASVRSGTKASATLWKNRKGQVCLMYFFSWIRESGTFERVSTFLERPIDFQEQIQYSCNGRHACLCYQAEDRYCGIPHIRPCGWETTSL